MKKLSEAARDFRYLLNRGYAREPSLNLVAGRFGLSGRERHLLARCVFPDWMARENRRKIVGIRKVRGRWLSVDGYNVLITTEAILRGEPVVRCDDGIIRDLSGVFGKYRFGERSEEAVREIISAISRAAPKRVSILFDKQVSRSGELASFVREMLAEAGVEGEVRAEGSVDLRVAEAEVSGSSDRVVIEKARLIWDIPAHILRRRGGKVIRLDRGWSDTF